VGVGPGWDHLVVLAWLALAFVLVGGAELVEWIDLARVWSRPSVADGAVRVSTVARCPEPGSTLYDAAVSSRRSTTIDDAPTGASGASLKP